LLAIGETEIVTWHYGTYPLDRLDFCASVLVGRQRGPSIAPSFVLFLVLGFSILARLCEAMILAFKGAEYVTDQRFTWW
jgi:hypothetical protein